MSLKNGFVAVLVVAVLLGGCGKKAAMSLKFDANDTATYKAVTESVKDYKFEQPSVNQSKNQQTVNHSEVVFDQKVQGVCPKGIASLLITIKSAKYSSQSPTGSGMDADSAKADSPLSKLVGQSYVVRVSADGNVAAIENADAARAAVAGDSGEAKVAQMLVSDEMIKARHSLPLPKKDGELRKGKSWSVVKASPAGMLVPKNYEKVYTLTDADDDKIVVKMEARPTSAKAAEVSTETAKGMGFFEKMFDSQESFKGELVMDAASGKVIKYNETLKADWIATEPAEEVKSDKGPDVLTMGFVYKFSVEKI